MIDRAPEDVAAEACARAYLRWSRIAGLPWRDAWVLRVATNLALDAVRRSHPIALESPQSDDHDAALTRTALVAALRQLPRRQREAISLRYLSDLPEEDVAHAMGISAGTVHTHIRRGLAALRSRLGPQFEDEEMSHALDLP